MRVRALSADGDMTFGNGRANYLSNTPEAVAQLVDTGLALLQGEWFLDTTVGVPYSTDVLGAHTQSTYDATIRSQILSTTGVTGIEDYASSTSPDRHLSIVCHITTLYDAPGSAPTLISVTL